MTIYKLLQQTVTTPTILVVITVYCNIAHVFKSQNFHRYTYEMGTIKMGNKSRHIITSHDDMERQTPQHTGRQCYMERKDRLKHMKEYFTVCHRLHVLKEWHSSMCSKLHFLILLHIANVRICNYSSTELAVFCALSIVSFLRVRQLDLFTFLRCKRRCLCILHLSVSDWSYNGTFPCTNTTSLIKQLITFWCTFQWRFSTKLWMK